MLAHGIYRRAMTVHDLPLNPVARVERHRVRSAGDIEVFEPEEIWALVRAAASEQDGAICPRLRKRTGRTPQASVSVHGQ